MVSLFMLLFATCSFFGQSWGKVISDDDCNNLSVVGGHNVFIQNAPYIAAIFEYKDLTCVGSIVHESFILTAASCASNVKKRILVGSARLHKGKRFYDVEKQLCHFNYSMYTGDNDICLFKLRSRIEFSHKVANVVLPQPNIYVADGAMMNVTGWGSVDTLEEKYPERLQQTTIPKISNYCCSKEYDDINDSVICAGATNRGACEVRRWDISATIPIERPWPRKLETIDSVQVGVYSAGHAERCGVGSGVYTKVAAYVEWINATITSNS